jgi:hypothetical protein
MSAVYARAVVVRRGEKVLAIKERVDKALFSLAHQKQKNPQHITLSRRPIFKD